jgi:hypothetical protein
MLCGAVDPTLTLQKARRSNEAPVESYPEIGVLRQTAGSNVSQFSLSD